MDGQNDSQITVATLADGSTSIRGPRGASIVLNGRIDDVMRMQLAGHLVGEMMARMLAAMDEALPDGAPFSIVVDAETQSGYEPEVRMLATAWLLRHKERLRPAHLLGKAPMVRMGIQMINNALGSKIFQVYDDRLEFERSVGKVVRDSERLRAARRS